jgi:outer membrane protein assembly factor BamB
MFKLFILVCGLSALASGVETRYWSQDTQGDFEKGQFKKVSLRSDGRLSLAPAVKELADLSIPYLWSALSAGDGRTYVAGGPGSGKTAIFEVSANGQQKKLVELEGMNIHAMALDRMKRLYAATSPDGKVYRIAANGSAELFYDPKAKYIWALAFDAAGDLLVATGDHGELHRVNASGAGKVWMKLDEDHLRSLLLDANGTVYLGTEPGGLIVKVDAEGNPFVVHQTGKREVTALLSASEGRIFAASIGLKSTGSPLQLSPVVVPPPPPAAGSANAGAPQRPPANIAPPVSMPVAGGSEVVEIDRDGAAMKVWSHPSEVVYALAQDAAGRVILGTGNGGALYRLDSGSLSVKLLTLPVNQVTGLVNGANNTLLAITGNVGKLFSIGAGLESEGSFESEVFDGSGFARWGRVHTKELANGGAVIVETRSGNLERPSKLWSPWAPLKEGRIVSPAARFLQWRVLLRGAASLTADGPELRQVDVAYLPKNLAPRVDIVEPTPANYRFPAPSGLIVPSVTTLTLPPIGKSGGLSTSSAVDATNSPSLTYTRGMIGARWIAYDENGDTLEYKIEIKGETEQTWKLLKEHVRERYLSYDATAFADGRYRIRVTASDAPDNVLSDVLTATNTSATFLLDNTAPVIRDLGGAVSGAKVNLRFLAGDALSVVSKAEVSINGGPWTRIEPTIRLLDSKDLDFRVSLDKLPGEMTIAVRLTDEFDNVSVEKVQVQ